MNYLLAFLCFIQVIFLISIIVYMINPLWKDFLTYSIVPLLIVCTGIGSIAGGFLILQEIIK
ncbi:MAG: hypothetical protein ACHQUC_01280 [Chlamydiales bacterium]